MRAKLFIVLAMLCIFPRAYADRCSMLVDLSVDSEVLNILLKKGYDIKVLALNFADEKEYFNAAFEGELVVTFAPGIFNGTFGFQDYSGATIYYRGISHMLKVDEVAYGIGHSKAMFAARLQSCEEIQPSIADAFLRNVSQRKWF